MPLPVYMICCDTIIVDETTKSPSFINVFNTIQAQVVKRETAAQRQASGFKMHAVAEWMRDDEKESDWLEYECLAFLPGVPTPAEMLKGRFRFEGPYYRIDMHISGSPPVKGAGLMRIECRVRKEGATDWIVQSYPIHVTINSPSDAQPETAP